MKKRKPKSLILVGNGINCEYETAHAHKLVGFEPNFIHINTLIENPTKIMGYTFITLPGGFLDGDDLGSAKAQAVRWKYQKISKSGKTFIDALISFVQGGNIILGICNGFQLLVKTGLLPGLGSDYSSQKVTLTFNDAGRFEDRWVYLKSNTFSHCIFIKDIHTIYLPVRHGEGKLVVDTKKTLEKMKQDGHIVMQYADDLGNITSQYPLNPNGSIESIAGLCDSTGRIFGLMPHPEAFVHRIQHPRWTREALPDEGDGLTIFKNAFKYVTENL
jgi:phosphoribosylformylglycinamidine synthase subunit PurQ / glutaminase